MTNAFFALVLFLFSLWLLYMLVLSVARGDWVSAGLIVLILGWFWNEARRDGGINVNGPF